MASFNLIDMKELSEVAIHLLEQDEVQGLEPVSNALTVLKSQVQHIESMLQKTLLS